MISATFQAGDLERGLQSYLDKITTDVVGGALEEALEPTREQAQAYLESVSSGKYSSGRTAQAGVKLAIRPSSDESVVFAEIGMRDGRGQGNRAFIGRFLEYGTARQAARPWLRPAWDAAKGEVGRLFAWAMRKRLGLAP